VGSVRDIKRLRRRMGIGAADASLTCYSGMAAVIELLDRLNVVKLLDLAIGPIKTRNRGIHRRTAAGRDGVDTSGQLLAAVPGTAAVLAPG
jgi:hypothetical protein